MGDRSTSAKNPRLELEQGDNSTGGPSRPERPASADGMREVAARQHSHNLEQGEQLKRDYDDFLRSVAQKGILAQYESKIEPKLQEAGLLDTNYINMDDEQRKQFKSIVRETYRVVRGEQLAGECANLVESMRQQGILAQFERGIKQKLQEARLTNTAFIDMDSTQREQFKSIVEKTYYGVKLASEYKHLKESMEQQGIYTQFKIKMEQKLQEARLLNTAFIDMDSTQREQFKYIAEETRYGVIQAEILEGEYKQIEESMRQQDIYMQFKVNMEKKLQEARLTNTAFIDMDSTQREQFESIMRTVEQDVHKDMDIDMDIETWIDFGGTSSQ